MGKSRAIKSIFAVLAFALSANTLPAYADVTVSAGGVGGGSTGVGTIVSTAVEIEMSEFTVSGTVYLPDGFTAPEGGIPIYGGFGGAALGDISLASTDANTGSGGGGGSSGGASAVVCPEEKVTEYEKAGVIATIPQGANKAEFEKTFSAATTSDALYGKFWVYDTDISSADGTEYLSNKAVVSNIVRIKSNKYSYTNVNATLETSENEIAYSVDFDDSLKAEKPNQTVFIIADDGYDEYITKRNFTRCDESISGIIRTESEEYTLKYYVPSTELAENQKIATGVRVCGTADFDEVSKITLPAQNCARGTVSRPDDVGDLKLKISTSKASVSVTVSNGAKSAEYVVGANGELSEFIKVEIINSDFYRSGYYDGTEFYEYKTYYGDISEPVAIELQRQCVIRGKVLLPETVVMAEKTWFRVNVKIENESGTYSQIESFIKYSDKDCEYSFFVPYEYADDSFLIEYYYVKYDDISFPKAAKNPLKYYSSSSGGGGGTSISGYTYELPGGLISDRLIYLATDGGTFYRDSAYAHTFAGNAVNADITLAENGAITEIPAVGGYFTDTLSVGGGAVIRLLDAETKSEKYRQDVTSGKYIFEDVAVNKYIISAEYGGKTYYYTGKKLTENAELAKIIDISATATNYGNDIYRDNIFPTEIRCDVAECIIGNESVPAEIGIYDIYGNCHGVYTSDDVFAITFSPFVMSVNDRYVSEYNLERYDFLLITKTEGSFAKAKPVESEYYYAFSGRNVHSGVNKIIIDAQVPDYAVSQVSLSDNFVAADIRKNFDGEEKDTVYFAAYSGGRLVDLVSAPLDIAKGKTQVTTERGLDTGTSGAEVKVFIWRDGIMPMMDAFILEK